MNQDPVHVVTPTDLSFRSSVPVARYMWVSSILYIFV